jgi:hypothetical protein
MEMSLCEEDDEKQYYRHRVKSNIRYAAKTIVFNYIYKTVTVPRRDFTLGNFSCIFLHFTQVCSLS